MNPTDPNKPQDLEYKDIRESSTRDIISEQHEAWDNSEWNQGEKKSAQAEEGKTQAQPETPREPEKPVEAEPAKQTPEVQTQQPTPPAEQKSTLDEEKLVEKITTKLLETLSPKEEVKQKTLDDRVAELQEKAQKEGRELTYKDALSAIKDELSETLPKTLTEQITKQVMENLNKEVDEETKKQQDTRIAEQKQEEANKTSLYGEWDRQVGVLQSEMGLPKIINKDDPEDPGVKAQENLFKALNIRADKQKQANQKVSLNLIEAFHSPEYKQLTEQPGASAPVNGAKRSVGPTGGQRMSYQELHNSDLRDLVAEVYKQPSN